MAEKDVERAIGLVVIDDGYTLVGRVKTEGRPEITIRFRPALPEDTLGYQMKFAEAKTGPERLACIAQLLHDHVDSWDGVYKKVGAGTHACQPIKWEKGVLDNPAIRRALGSEYLVTMANFVNQYTGADMWEGDAKN